MRFSLKPFIGSIYTIPAWDVEQGYGSFLTFEFGKPHQKIYSVRKRKPTKDFPTSKERLVVIRGDWHLWIYCCGWRISQEKKVLAHNESTKEKIARACLVLNGQALRNISVDLSTKHTFFEFDLGGRLETGSYDKELNEHWMLYCPNKRVFSFRSDGCYSFQRGDTDPSKEKWKPLKV